MKTKAEVKKEIQNLRKQWDYHQAKFEQDKTSNDDFLLSMRTISRPLNLLEAIDNIYDVIESLNTLQVSYDLLLKIGSAEDKLNEGNISSNFFVEMSDHENRRRQIISIMLDSLHGVKTGISKIKPDDLLQDIIDKTGF